ncbi:MAG TPA: hypothetical protein VI968_00630 [archaeon]|nr:hypothetical protein [archaeon]
MMPLPTICPFCNSDIKTVNEIHTGVAEKIFYTCPKCNRILSVEKAR